MNVSAQCLLAILLCHQVAVGEKDEIEKECKKDKSDKGANWPARGQMLFKPQFLSPKKTTTPCMDPALTEPCPTTCAPEDYDEDEDENVAQSDDDEEEDEEEDEGYGENAVTMAHDELSQKSKCKCTTKKTCTTACTTACTTKAECTTACTTPCTEATEACSTKCTTKSSCAGNAGKDSSYEGQTAKASESFPVLAGNKSSPGVVENRTSTGSEGQVTLPILAERHTTPGLVNWTSPVLKVSGTSSRPSTVVTETATEISSEIGESATTPQSVSTTSIISMDRIMSGNFIAESRTESLLQAESKQDEALEMTTSIPSSSSNKKKKKKSKTKAKAKKNKVMKNADPGPELLTKEDKEIDGNRDYSDMNMGFKESGDINLYQGKESHDDSMKERTRDKEPTKKKAGKTPPDEKYWELDDALNLNENVELHEDMYLRGRKIGKKKVRTKRSVISDMVMPDIRRHLEILRDRFW